jgi:choline dehydrogenase-like flavoprotein
MTFMLRHPNAIAAAEALSRRGKGGQRVWGAKLQEYLQWYHHKGRELVFEAFGEFLANPGTFVSIAGDVRDRWGTPSAQIHLAPHPEDTRNASLIAAKGLEVLRAAGAVQAQIESQGGTTFVLQHGTCRFGADATRSVLDPHCRAWEVDNLYVVDGSFMPTSGGVPSTLTILANSFRVADHLVKRFKERTLQ